MNKTAIKNFAIWARNKLIADVSYDARLIGITEDGIAKPLPQSFGGTQFFDIGTAEPYSISGEAVRQRDKLIEVIQQKEKDTDYKTAYQYVIEEVAYTWFNRLIAIRFMEVNDYLPSHIRVLSSESGKLEPDLVTTPFDAELPFTAEEEAQIFQLKQDNKLDEVFRILFLKQCNALNEILPALFEKTKNYTELLLSLSVIDQDGVVYHLIHDIPEDDFNIERGGQVEIIGWLYQYYNTEPKAAAFAKNGKITKEEIPAVTQLFTPDWIVRYMVENSLGRLWVEGHPDCGLKENWKYYLEEAQQEPEVQAKLAEIRKEYAALNPEDIKLIDLVIELVDARVPFSSRNPDIDKLAAGKARMVLLNKADLADEAETRKWAQMFEDMGIHVVKIDARNKGTLKQVQAAQQEACKEKIERDRRRGILNRPIRTMVVGIPNVGKSTFINSFAGKACAKTGNKPGVTKGNQWIRLNKTLELLDTPGILWPRFEDQQVGLHLALIGSINDQILNKDELACELISLLEKDYPQVVKDRFGIENVEEDRVKVLEEIARSRACLMKGGELDLARASALLLDDFRAGKLGRISLEKAEDYKDRIKVK